MYLFLVPLLLGFALDWASAFTTAYSRRWGSRGGQRASAVLRNVLGLPLVAVGLGLAFPAPSPQVFAPAPATDILGWVLEAAGCLLIVWALVALRVRAAAPSVQDALEERGPYAHVRHPLYSGVLVVFVGLALLCPSHTALLACALGVVWIIVQARLEERDLLERIPAYREYMGRVPRFVPRFWRKESLQTK